MSQTETHFGKLRKVDIGEQTLEQWCEAKCNEIGITQLSSYSESWQDELHDSREFYEKFFIVDNEVWEAIEHTELEDGYDIDILNPNEDGTITFVQQFYNGGTCLSECIEEGLKRMKKQIMVDTSNTHKENGLVQKSLQLYNTGFRITVSIATGVCGESTSISIYDSNLYADDDSRSDRFKEYIIPVDDVEDLNELADMLKSCVKERNKTLNKKK